MNIVNNFCVKVLNLSKFLDFLIGTSFLFLVCFVWARYFLHNFWLTIFVCSLATFLIVSLYHILKKQKQQQLILTEQEKNYAEMISTKFLLMTKQEILQEFQQNLEKKYKTTIKSDFIIINESILRPVFCCKTITDKEIIESFSKTKNISAKKLIVVCKNATPEAKNIASMITSKKVIVLEEFESYDDIYKPLGFEIPKDMQQKKRKSFDDYLSFAFKKQRTKNYLTVALFLLISSFVLRYNIYYIVFASITTLFGLYAHFNTRYNLPKKSNIE